MNPTHTVLLVGATDETVVKAVALGLRVLLLQHPTKVSDEQRRLAEAVEVVDYTRWDLLKPLVQRLRTGPGFDLALSLTEPGLENAARVNDLFGLGGTSHAVTLRFRDKEVMRRHLAAHDPAGAVRAAPLRERADLAAFGARVGYPFIVKPTDATASIGVQRVAGAEDIERVWHAVQALVGTRTDRVSTLFVLRDFLMEEYVDGPEFSIESFSFAGRHVVVAITEKFTDPAHFAELGHAVPARLDEAAEESVRTAVSRFLDVMGMRDGVCHTEIRLGPHGPRVIESHNRVAGDAIPELVEAAYGIDLMTLALAWPFRLAGELPERPRAHAGASVRTLVGDAGTVRAVEGVAEAKELADVIDVRISAKPGAAVRPVRDNWDRLGLVAVTGADTAAAVARGARLVRDVVHVRLTLPDGTPALARVATAAGTESPENAEVPV
ncbi:ATP-grasp domain-containing protein (plasmid) [Streptomyces sp. NBC_01450]|uniref:ATP-grasp domain-containing protein n=1 Tax=Streptomyces sp. NBC_01450 TaxID=2903871 RepID=UPI002E319993|nr:ATP-grasp domain-containing protein [Streptomyces sp. NBC_01450]